MDYISKPVHPGFVSPNADLCTGDYGDGTCGGDCSSNSVCYAQCNSLNVCITHTEPCFIRF